MILGDSITKRGLAIVKAAGGNSALDGYYHQMTKLVSMGPQGVQTQEHVVLRAAVADWPVAGGEKEERARSRFWAILPKASLPVEGGHVDGQTYQSHTH